MTKRTALHDRGHFLVDDDEGSSTKRQKTLPFDDNPDESLSSMTCHPISSTSNTSSNSKSALQLLMEEEEQRKRLAAKKSSHFQERTIPAPQRPNDNTDVDIRLPNWLHRQIVVKILNKRLANGRYYKLKGVIEDIVADGYVGVIRILPNNPDIEEMTSSERIKIDQEELETVIPQVLLSIQPSYILRLAKRFSS